MYALRCNVMKIYLGFIGICHSPCSFSLFEIKMKELTRCTRTVSHILVYCCIFGFAFLLFAILWGCRMCVCVCSSRRCGGAKMGMTVTNFIRMACMARYSVSDGRFSHISPLPLGNMIRNCLNGMGSVCISSTLMPIGPCSHSIY